MTCDEQARQRLVDLALAVARFGAPNSMADPTWLRRHAGFRDPSKGSWCAAGLTAAMAQAGLLVPAPGTPARRGAIALLDFLHEQRGAKTVAQRSVGKIIVPDDWQADIAPGDIIAWLQHPPPDPAGWRRGHVAVIVATDGESITTVGWNEGSSPGRVMMRRLWRDSDRRESYRGEGEWSNATFTRRVPRSATVLLRRPGGLYDIARPVAA